MGNIVLDQAIPYLKDLWRHRWFIVGITVVAAVVTAISAYYNEAYRAETILTISDFRGSGRVEELLPEVVNPKAYEQLVDSWTVVSATHARLEEQGFWEEGSVPDILEFKLLHKLHVTTLVVDQTTRPVNYAPFLWLGAVAEDPDKARAVVDAWAHVAMESAARANRLRVETVLAPATEQTQQHRELLDKAWGDLAVEEASFDVEIMTRELTLVTENIVRLEQQIATLEGDRANAMQRFEAAQKQLANENEKIELFKAPSDDVFWLTEEEGKEGAEDRGMRTEVVNPFYSDLKMLEAEASQDLSGIEAQIAALQQQLDVMTTRRTAIQESKAQHVFAQKKLQKDADVLEPVYTELAAMEGILEAVASISTFESDGGEASIGLNRLADKAVAWPYDPIVGKKARVLAAAALAASLACALVISRGALAQLREALKDEAESPTADTPHEEGA